MTGKYTLIYADPPWTYRDKAADGERGAGFKYPVMSVLDICRVPVWELAADDCLLAMWWVPTQPLEALKVVEAWGFRLMTMKGFTWHKTNKHKGNSAIGMGHMTRANSEDCLFAVRGKLPERMDASICQHVTAHRMENSRKPDIVREKMVQLLGDVPRIELFSRSAAPGWHHWGNECPSSITLNPGTVGPSELYQVAFETECAVWPAEVEMVFSAVDDARTLTEKNKRKLKSHINRMWLEKTPVPQIVVSARSLIGTMERIS